MKFALLGIDDAAFQVVRELARSDEHALRFFAPATSSPSAKSQEEEVRRHAPLAELLTDWEVLLAPRLCDAVIVAGRAGATERFEQMRRLIQERVPLFITHPPAVSLLEAYELEMVRQETGAIVIPLLPWHGYPWFQAWTRSIQDSLLHSDTTAELGRVEQVTWQRSSADRSRESALAHFARDVSYLRAMCGEVTQIAALGATLGGRGLTAPNYSALAIQMSGETDILVRWSVSDVDDPNAVCITVAGDQGKQRLELAQDPPRDIDAIRYFPPASFEQERLDESAFEDVSLPALMAEQLRLAEQGSDAPLLATHLSWPDAIRSLELVEAVEKSLKKGRTISVGVEGRTESDAFKGTMASLGCVLLVVGLLVVIGSAAVLKIAEKTGNQALVGIFRWWPALLVGVFGIFLLLQFLRFIIPKVGENRPRR